MLIETKKPKTIYKKTKKPNVTNLPALCKKCVYQVARKIKEQRPS